MVGRLVEEQDVGLRREHAGKRRAPRLAAGEARRLLLAGEAELLEQKRARCGSSPGASPASTKASVVAKPVRSGSCGR